MLKFEEGQTYICIKTLSHRWTEGKEYPVIYNNFNRSGIKDNTSRFWYEHEINNLPYIFILKEEPQTPDLIENQPHYKNQSIEPIDLMRNNFSKEEYSGFLQGNVLKYMLRYKDKNGLEDLKKAKTYLTWLIEEEENAKVQRN